MLKIKNTITKGLSLGIGLAAGIVLMAKICYETSMDKCYDDFDRIYHIRTVYSVNGNENSFDNISGAVAPGFKQYIPGVESATRMTFVWNSDKYIDEHNNIVTGTTIVADSCFFDVFSTEILSGNPKEVLAIPAQAMISETLADKLGGVDKAMGKLIANEELQEFKITVGGVFKDFPYHSSVKYDVLLSMESLNKRSTENWVGNDGYNGYVKLSANTDADMLAPAIREMQLKNQPWDEFRKAGVNIRYYLRSLSGEHISEPNIRSMVTILSIVAILLIVISMLNYILFSLSVLAERSKEMGVRKCFGAEKRVIYGIMASEAAIDVLSASITAAVLILSFKNILEDLVGIPVNALFTTPAYFTVAGIVILIFFVAAFVPGFLYSRVPVSAAFRSISENKRHWKHGLLLLQSGICAMLLSLVFIIGTQYDKAVNDKPGYEYQNLLWTVLTGTDKTKHQGIIDQLKQIPGITDVQMSYSLPLDHSSGNNIYMGEGPEKGKELFNVADQYEATSGFFEMLEIPFIQGNYPQSETEVAVSESFVSKMSGFEDWSDGAVGKRIYITEHSATNNALTISGVYKDYRIGTLTSTDNRASIRFLGKTGRTYMPFMSIKVDNISPGLIATIQKTIQDRIPEKEIEVKAYKDSMREAYAGERRIKNTIIAGCIISVVIALFGLSGYIRDESRRRSKEMAIRKINGASAKEIVCIYLAEILRLCTIAIILGNIGGWFAADIWLMNFSEKISISPIFFIAADAIILTLIISTVVAGSITVAQSNPVESLKDE